MDKFGIRSICFLLIIGLILMYNWTIQGREQNEKIANLEAQVDALYEQQNELIKRLNETANKNSEEVKIERKEEKKGAFADYKDGEYEGSAQGFGGEILVKLTIEKGVMTKLQIMSAQGEDRSYLEMASGIVNTILKEQSVDVDTVSGATFSSKGIIGASQNALEKAKK